MESSEQIDKSLANIIVKRVAILLLVLCLLSLFFWTVGSFRTFLDETQIMLIGVLRWSSLGLAAASVCGLALTIARAGRVTSKLWGLAGYLVLFCIGVAALALSDALIFLSRGL